MEKVKVAIIGSGNIGTDLMYKLRKSEVIELNSMIGIDSESDGLKRAKEAGYEVFDNGIQAIIDRPSIADIVFDATSAKAHSHHAKVLEELGKIVIDLTPAAYGPFVCPAIQNNNFTNKQNVNMITCGGQATIPIVHAINEVANVTYAEVVAAISSLSAGPGTRANIDEFTITTRRGIEEIGGADYGKALIILNPAEPPILMRDTVYCEVKYMDEDSIREAIRKMVEVVRTYVPGYSLKQEPMFDGNRVTVFLEVEGAGDYFPPYAGNLDIMTAAALKVGEECATQIISEKKRGVMNEAK
ncbi:acetaldehyde dehydrogenase (acetylating) [Bacillus cereus]|nr:acetaldehyde dehydrogenase (acetylating) [Bacillus cereus]PGU62899.1 acetaldehyde dehydrogenase (acetylating) [Bacillus cereus]